MIESYKTLTEKMQQYLDQVPYDSSKRGYLKKLITLHYDEFREAERYLNQKDLVAQLGQTLGISLSHTYVNRVLSAERKKRGQAPQPKTVEKKATKPLPPAVKTESTNKPQEEERDVFGRRPYPKQEVTEEKLAEWEKVKPNLPKVAKYSLIIFGVTMDEYLATGVAGISSNIEINQRITALCKKKERDWYEAESKRFSEEMKLRG